MVFSEEKQQYNNDLHSMINILKIFSNQERDIGEQLKNYLPFPDVFQTLADERVLLSQIINSFDSIYKLATIIQNPLELEEAREYYCKLVNELEEFAYKQKTLVHQSDLVKMALKQNNLYGYIEEKKLANLLHHTEYMIKFSEKMLCGAKESLREINRIENSVCGMMSIGSIDDIITTDD